MNSTDLEYVFDAIAELLDKVPKEKRELTLAKLALCLANEGDLAAFKRAIAAME